MTDRQFYRCVGFLANSARTTRIEVEIRSRDRQSFERDYAQWTNNFSLPRRIRTKPYYVWPAGANKWGKEFRCYFNSDQRIPRELYNILEPRKIQNRPGYLYKRRISRKWFVEKLFRTGFVLGGIQDYNRIRNLIPNRHISNFNAGYRL